MTTMTNTKTVRLLLAAAATGLWAMTPASAQVYTANVHDDNGNVGPGPGPTPPRDWDPDDLPVTEETIAINMELYEMREEIAQQAVWIGPGPNDIQTILAGDNPDWIDEMRAEAYAIVQKLRSPGGLPAGIGMNDDAGDPGAGNSDIAWYQGANPAGFDSQPDNRSHFVINLWPTVQTSGGIVAEIPYTFSNNMIAGFVAGGGSAEQANAAAGVANAFVVMLLLEQEMPIRFVGFNPNIHAPTEILLLDSAGTGNPIDTGDGNTVSQMGRASSINANPTTMTHNTWQNFPSMIRSFGFVIGLDWEQRHPNRDTYIDVDLAAIPPAGFPMPFPPVNGVEGPGMTTTTNSLGFFDSGPLLFDQTVTVTLTSDTPGCDFDLDSIMLMGPHDFISLQPAYTIKDAFRYVDLNGDGTVDTTEGGPDDRMFSQPFPVFFSDCDRAVIQDLYQTLDGPGSGWYFGKDDFCPHDVDQNGIQDARDIRDFIEMFNNRDPAADIAPLFGEWTQADLLLFMNGPPQFVPGFCSDTEPPGPANRPDRVFPD